jgi:hypothetical protein
MLRSFLFAMPTPLPMEIGGKPEAIVRQKDEDLRVAIGRAIGAALVQSATDDPLSVYPGWVTIMGTGRPEEADLHTLENPHALDLAALIADGLEMIIEYLHTQSQN